MTDQAPPASDDERIGVAKELGWDGQGGDAGSLEERASAFFTTEHLSSGGRSLPENLDQDQLDAIRDAVVRRAAAHDPEATARDVIDGAGSKAEPTGGSPAGDVLADDPDALGEESFPASDPPGSY